MILNLERGSGIKGLSGISSARGIGAARLIRPLLSFSKGQLEATAKLRGVPIAYDPSNSDLAYSRTRVRAQMTEARANRLSETTTRLAQEDAALEITVAELAANALTLSPLGWARISMPNMAQAPSVIALRLFARTVHAIGGREMPPRQDRVQAALDQVLSGEKTKLTIGGTIVTRQQERLSVWREAGKTYPSNLEQPGKWDGRFDVLVEPFWPEGTEVRFMGYEGLRQMETMGDRILPDSTAPRAVLAALPSLWNENKLVAGPCFQTKSPGVDGICLKAHFHPPRPITPC
jgi:tRNA(Ile)-lysidine synthase